ncbi:MAG TPA: HPr kinase/phosphorylase [Betaproteobacteria bacterium]|jgi:HPr kinase/phosphorylase|nr:HPr kinase/phosphorylase [Betaproteobacteria bacterium]
MPQLSVQRLFDDRRDKLSLTWVGGHKGASRLLNHDALNRPGVGLVGHLNLIHPILIQALGVSDIEYLDNLEAAERTASLKALCTNETLAIFLCDGADAPTYLVDAADEYGTPLFLSLKKSRVFVNLLRPYLQRELSEITTSHGVFLDVLGFGILITGDSQIGKSELALELISRGAGLVADDAVELYQVGPETIQGRCPPLLRDFLEVRGIGVLNIRAIFGETAVRPRKTLRLIVHLERPTKEYFQGLDRLQTKSSTTAILGVEISTVTLAVVAGRNLAVLVEAAVRHYILQTRGYDSTRDFLDRHEAAMREQADVSNAQSRSDGLTRIDRAAEDATSAFDTFGPE